MTITLSADVEAKLREKALREGRKPDALADELLGRILEWEAQAQAEAVEGIRRGLEDFEAGRYRSFDEFATEQRRKHNLPTPS